MFKNISKLLIALGLIPFLIYLILLVQLQAKINFFTILITIFLFLGGYGIGIFNKKINMFSLFLIIIVCVSSFILGLFNEKFYLFETLLSVILAFYYVILYYANYYMVKTKKYREEINDYFENK